MPQLPPNAPALLTGIAAVLSAVAWPVLIGAVLIWFRRPVRQFVTAAVLISETASKVRIWQIEFDRDVKQELAHSESTALAHLTHYTIPEEFLSSPIPKGEIQAATRVRTLLAEAPDDSVRSGVMASIRQRLYDFAQEYETTRANMPSGTERTRAMNGVAAKMRTLALAADPFLHELHDSDSPGRRLAAVCILQLAPNLDYIDWLAQRMGTEQPFIFFHASVALLSAVRKYGQTQATKLKGAIEKSLQTIESYGDARDANTIRTLTLALSELEAPPSAPDPAGA
jgi:hypothetical protein